MEPTGHFDRSIWWYWLAVLNKANVIAPSSLILGYTILKFYDFSQMFLSLVRRRNFKLLKSMERFDWSIWSFANWSGVAECTYWDENRRFGTVWKVQFLTSSTERPCTQSSYYNVVGYLRQFPILSGCNRLRTRRVYSCSYLRTYVGFCSRQNSRHVIPKHARGKAWIQKTRCSWYRIKAGWTGIKKTWKSSCHWLRQCLYDLLRKCRIIQSKLQFKQRR